MFIFVMFVVFCKEDGSMYAPSLSAIKHCGLPSSMANPTHIYLTENKYTLKGSYCGFMVHSSWSNRAHCCSSDFTGTTERLGRIPLALNSSYVPGRGTVWCVQ